MKRTTTIALCAALAATGAGCTGGSTNSPVDFGSARDQASRPVDMTDLSMIDPLGNSPKVAKVEVGTTFKYAQSPQWVPTLGTAGALLLSDTTSNMIYQLTLPTTLTPFRTNSSGSNGLAYEKVGAQPPNLVVCEFATRQVTRRPLTGGVESYTPIVTGGFNGPNDVTVRSDGTIYFTDPGATQPALDTLYRIAPGGTMAVALDKTMRFPNGVALSPLENTLYVAAATDGKVFKFPVNSDGSLGPRGDFAQGLTNCGGLAVDEAGNVYVATPSGVRLFKEDGTPRGSLTVPEPANSLGFGGADLKTLFITGPTSLYSVTLQVPGRL